MEGDATLHHGECEFFTLSCEPHKFWIYLSASLAIITAAGLMAGLTMGLVSLDMRNMRILEMEGSPDEKARAKRIIPIISRHHLLLVTLLLGNACANEALPIFLSKLVPETVSILLSVTCVLLFGEIIPSAIFTGPNQLKIASSLTPVVRALMLLTSPVSYPIAKILDYALGSDHSLARYKRQELKALVALQRENDGLHQSIKKVRRRRRRNAANPDDHEASGSEYEDNDDHQTHYVEHHDMQNEPVGEHAGQGTQLHVDEVTIIHGALDLTAKTIRQVMIPIDQVFMLEYHTKLDANVLADILASGHSRIPIYKDHKANIVGVLLVKRLIVLDPADARPVSDLALRKPIVVNPSESCYHILNEFQKGGSHLALVTADASKVAQCWKDRVDIPKSVSFVGIITIEDVIEELIQEEIEDESDVRANGIVRYWRARSNKREAFKKSSSSMSSTLGKSTFVVARLKSLAERARARVQSRSGPRKRPTSATRGGLQEPEPPLEVRIDLHEPASPKEE